MTRRPSITTLTGRLGHLILLVIGWVLFGAFWVKVMLNPHDNGHTVAMLIAVAIVVVPGVTLVWVLHNRNLYKRKGPRGASFTPRESYESDWEGRAVRADWDAVRSAQRIHITASETEKFFRALS